jgi:transcriptional regulator NrdR family protein
MKCPSCRTSQTGHREPKIIDSRPCNVGIRRRRTCPTCKYRFTTFEIPLNLLIHGVIGRQVRGQIILHPISKSQNEKDITTEAIKNARRKKVT